jgi:hypothetical protein
MGLGDKAEELFEKVGEVLADAETPEEQPDPDLTPAERLREAQWEIDNAVQIDDKR